MGEGPFQPQLQPGIELGARHFGLTPGDGTNLIEQAAKADETGEVESPNVVAIQPNTALHSGADGQLLAKIRICLETQGPVRHGAEEGEDAGTDGRINVGDQRNIELRPQRKIPKTVLGKNGKIFRVRLGPDTLVMRPGVIADLRRAIF